LCIFGGNLDTQKGDRYWVPSLQLENWTSVETSPRSITTIHLVSLRPMFNWASMFSQPVNTSEPNDDEEEVGTDRVEDRPTTPTPTTKNPPHSNGCAWSRTKRCWIGHVTIITLLSWAIHPHHASPTPSIIGLHRSVRIRTKRKDDQYKALPSIPPYHLPQGERKETDTIIMLTALDLGEESNPFRDAVLLSSEATDWMAACTKECDSLFGLLLQEETSQSIKVWHRKKLQILTATQLKGKKKKINHISAQAPLKASSD
jgi:hypothetical protein